MIHLDHLTKVFTLDGRAKTVADDICQVFPTGKAVALLGRNGAGKSSLLQMIAGTLDPTSGRIHSTGTISWPVGFAGSFHPDLTGVQNVRFVGRIYAVDTDALVDFVGDFAELGVHYNLPFRSYSSGMRSRLAFGVSMGIHFDTYLVDEVTAVGDAAFRMKSLRYFGDRLRNAGAVMVTHSMGQVREVCDAVAVLDRGKMRYFDDVGEGIAYHERNMSA